MVQGSPGRETAIAISCCPTEAQTTVRHRIGIAFNIRPVAKQRFLDLLAADYSLVGPSFPEKIEGIAFGPKLPDGSRILIVTSDNDFKSDQPTEIYAFAVRRPAVE